MNECTPVKVWKENVQSFLCKQKDKLVVNGDRLVVQYVRNRSEELNPIKIQGTVYSELYSLPKILIIYMVLRHYCEYFK